MPTTLTEQQVKIPAGVDNGARLRIQRQAASQEGQIPVPNEFHDVQPPPPAFKT